jgi:hypothetical protein
VVGRTVRHARKGIEADADDPATIIQREAQLLLNCRGSPIVGQAGQPQTAGGPLPGDRAPDCSGLVRDIARFPMRLFDLLEGQNHTLFLYADHSNPLDGFRDLAVSARQCAHGRLDVYAILAPGVHSGDLQLPIICDGRNEFRNAYAARNGEGYLVRPDGYLGLRAYPVDEPSLLNQLGSIFTQIPA